MTSTGNLERYIKIASELEHKSVRDVAFKASEVMVSDSSALSTSAGDPLQI